MLLPAWCVSGRADDADTIGSALQAAVAGQGHRPIADRLGVPTGTVRGWLHAARAGTQWRYQTAVTARDRVNIIRDDPALPLPDRTPLAHAIDALGAAAAAIRRFFGAALRISGWQLIVLITGGRGLRWTGPTEPKPPKIGGVCVFTTPPSVPAGAFTDHQPRLIITLTPQSPRHRVHRVCRHHPQNECRATPLHDDAFGLANDVTGQQCAVKLITAAGTGKSDRACPASC